jgi:hypothetical protein
MADHCVSLANVARELFALGTMEVFAGGLVYERLARLTPSSPHAVHVKLHGCFRRYIPRLLWSKQQLGYSPFQERVREFSEWLPGVLQDRDLVFVGFWSDWFYLNGVLGSVIRNSQVSRFVLVNASSEDDLSLLRTNDIARAGSTWSWLAAPSGIPCTWNAQLNRTDGKITSDRSCLAPARLSAWLGAHQSHRRLHLAHQLSRCTQFPESRSFVFNPFPGFDCIFTALKSRTVALKTRTKFLLKFVRDISTKMTLSFLRASLSVRDLSTNSSANSGN